MWKQSEAAAQVPARDLVPFGEEQNSTSGLRQRRQQQPFGVLGQILGLTFETFFSASDCLLKRYLHLKYF